MRYNINMNKEEIQYLDIAVEMLKGKSFSVFYENNMLDVKLRSGNDIFEECCNLTIKSISWKPMFLFIRKFNVWRLEKQYGSELIAKLWWHMNMQTNSRKIVTCGINIFPDFKNVDESNFYSELCNTINIMTNKKLL